MSERRQKLKKWDEPGNREELSSCLEFPVTVYWIYNHSLSILISLTQEQTVAGLQSHLHGRSLATKWSEYTGRMDQPRGPQLLQTPLVLPLHKRLPGVSLIFSSVLIVWALIFMRAISEAKRITVSRPSTCPRLIGVPENEKKSLCFYNFPKSWTTQKT